MLADLALVDAWWIRIVQAYTEHGRHYHTLQHVERMLRTAANHSDLGESRIRISLAIFFHECVSLQQRGSAGGTPILTMHHFPRFCFPQHRVRSDSQGQRGEERRRVPRVCERGAAGTTQRRRGWGHSLAIQSAALAADVDAMIRATIGHTLPEAAFADMRLFLDLDLEVLSWSEKGAKFGAQSAASCRC